MRPLLTKRPKVEKLMLTPIIDMFVTIMIFLLISFSPDNAKIKASREIKLPKSEHQFAMVPKLQVEVTKDYVKLNGKELPGLKPESEDGKAWQVLKAKLDEMQKSKDEPVLVIADRLTSFKYVDRTVAYLAAAGHSTIFLLTQKEKKETN